MAKVQPYSIEQAKALVVDAKQRSDRRHNIWQGLELLYRRGEVSTSLEEGDVPGVLWDELPGLTLDAVNMVLPNIQIMTNQAMAYDPSFVVEPYQGGDEAEQEAKVGEQLLRYFWKRGNGTDVHRSMVQDAVVLGSGFCKVGWAFLEEEVERDDSDLVAELEEMLAAEERDADLMERSPRSAGELAELIALQEPRIVMDEPFIEYVSPYDLFLPRNARRLEECRWIAQRIVLPIDEVEANESFDRDAVKELKTTSVREDRPDQRPGEAEGSEAGADFTEGDDPFREVTLFEFYDMRTRRLLVFQEDAGKALLDEDLPYSHRHSPFVHMRNLEDGGRRFWSFGDVENIATIQNEYNQYWFEQMSSARRAGNKYAVDDRSWNPEIKDFLESEQSDVAFPIKTNNRPLAEIIQSMQRQPVSAEVFQAKADLEMAAHNTLGINDFQAGGSGADRMSATAAAVVDGNATLRGSDKRWQVERAAAETGLRMLLLCQEFLDEQMALRIIGPDGNVEWLNVTKDDLIGEFGVSITSGSTMAVNPATQMQRALDVMTEIIPALAQDGFDTQPFWREALRDYGMDPDRMLRRLPPPPPEGGGPTGAGAPPPTVPQEALGGPPIDAAVEGDIAL